jgi:hypothetical protein
LCTYTCEQSQTRSMHSCACERAGQTSPPLQGWTVTARARVLVPCGISVRSQSVRLGDLCARISALRDQCWMSGEIVLCALDKYVSGSEHVLPGRRSLCMRRIARPRRPDSPRQRRRRTPRRDERGCEQDHQRCGRWSCRQARCTPSGRPRRTRRATTPMTPTSSTGKDKGEHS